MSTIPPDHDTRRYTVFPILPVAETAQQRREWERFVERILTCSECNDRQLVCCGILEPSGAYDEPPECCGNPVPCPKCVPSP